MIITNNFCKNCGSEYKFQASGSVYRLDTPKSLNDPDYCPICKKAINEALSKIKKKTVIKYIDTDIVDLNTLLEWRRLNREEQKNQLPQYFPIMERIFSSLYNRETGDSTQAYEIKGRNEHSDKLFYVNYWANSKKVIDIKIKARVDMNNKVVKYEK